jgi:hypothetical protein
MCANPVPQVLRPIRVKAEGIKLAVATRFQRTDVQRVGFDSQGEQLEEFFDWFVDWCNHCPARGIGLLSKRERPGRNFGAPHAL